MFLMDFRREEEFGPIAGFRRRDRKTAAGINRPPHSVSPDGEKAEKNGKTSKTLERLGRGINMERWINVLGDVLFSPIIVMRVMA